MQPIDLPKFARFIRMARDYQTFKQAAAVIGISEATLRRLEQGHAPGPRSFVKVCEWLGFSPQVFARE